MQVSQKTRYALRALFELAKRHGEGPVRIGDIARKQAIPQRFLEAILNQLKQAGLLRSVRGPHGGYELAADPTEISVGDMMRILEGPLQPTLCIGEDNSEDCPLFGNCVFVPLWERAAQAMSEVYDGTTFADLVNQERMASRSQALNYTI